MKRRLYKRNDSVKEEVGHPRNTWLATMINPVDHQLYDILAFRNSCNVVRPEGDYQSPEQKIYIYGKGYYESDSREIDGEDFFRSHTPSGVAKKGRGLGLLLYSGLSIQTVSEESSSSGIYSVSGDRSDKAEQWWKAQVEREYVDEYDDSTEDEFETEILVTKGMIDMCEKDCDASMLSVYPEEFLVTVQYSKSVELQTLPAVNVVKAGLVLAWDEEDEELNNLFEQADWEPPPTEVLLGLDLSTTKDPKLLINILEHLQKDEEVTLAQLRKFVDRFSGELKGVTDSKLLLEILGKQNFEFEANPKLGPVRVKSDKAWKDFYGDLAVPGEL